MQVRKIADGFYSLSDVFSEDQLSNFREMFETTSTRTYEVLDPREQGRMAWNLSIDEFAEMFKDLAEEKFDSELWESDSMLWHDPKGFFCDMHVDRNTNIAVSIQVYLDDGDFMQGTQCETEDGVFMKGYRRNTGYLMLNPRDRRHGMKSPAGTDRKSFYMYFRDKETPEDTSVRGGGETNPDGLILITDGSNVIEHSKHLPIPKGWTKKFPDKA